MKLNEIRRHWGSRKMKDRGERVVFFRKTISEQKKSFKQKVLHKCSVCKIQKKEAF